MVGISGELRYKPAAELRRRYDDLLVELARRNGVKVVAELGGGANPIVANADAWGFVPGRVVFDISAEELSKAEGNVEKRVVDLCQPVSGGRASYDMVFSKMLCEHLPDAHAFHQNCFNLLRSGGLAVHLFPTLFAAPFVVNRLLPENLTRSIVRRVQPGRLDDPKLGKFPAHYRWCTGPIHRTLRRYQSIGFEVEEWNGGFGHTYYNRIPLLDAAERAKSNFLIRHPVASLTSFAMVVLRKPE
jgi:SAM-dependent methyltransferase